LTAPRSGSRRCTASSTLSLEREIHLRACDQEEDTLLRSADHLGRLLGRWRPRPPSPNRISSIAQGPKVRRLPAGGEWIRTSSSARDRQRFRGFGRLGADRPSARRYHPRSCRP
jgi:hypothetical protein